VVSNGRLADKIETIRACKLEGYFDKVLTSEETGFAKPHSEIFHHALNYLGVRPANAIMIGDNWEDDIRGAVQCGIPAVWLRRREPTSKLSPIEPTGSQIFVVESLRQLRDMVP
jgi:FMN phosphatase YigB (HAD superfamily)